MTSFLLLAALVFNVTPEVKQGEVVRIVAKGDSAPASARMNDKQIKLFSNGSGQWLGLMPVAIDQKPGPLTVTVRDASGRELHKATVKITDAKYPIQDIVATKQMKELKPLPGEMEAVRALQQRVTDKRYWSEEFLLPVRGCRISPFGVARYHNGKPSGNFHRGLDQRAGTGVRIRAAADGVVRIAKPYRMHGGTVGIDHGQGVITMYLHMSKIIAKEGATVKAGEIIGLAGATGFATGPHLHWAIYVNGMSVNPEPWIPAIKSCY